MSRLSSLKKGELVALATDFGLDTEGIKVDIESRISQHLAQNEATLSTNPTYAHFYNASPSKSRRKSAKKADEEESPSKAMSSSPLKSMTQPEVHEEESEGDEEEGNESVLEKSREFMTEISDRVTDAYYDVQDWVEDYSSLMRQSFSNIHFINSVATALEFAVMVTSLSRWTAIPITSTFTVFLPHADNLVSYDNFWRPLIVWTFFSVAMPLLASYFINFTGAASGSRRKSKGQSDFDPVIYNLTRLVTSYVVYQGYQNGLLDYISTWGVFCDALKATIPVIDAILGEFPKISGSIVLALSIYAAIA